MKREEKNALSKQRILEAALQEFSARGYANASLNTVCSEYKISKGIIYHHFKDKDELYLLCVKHCFDAVTTYLKETVLGLAGAPEQQIQTYFQARLRFFAENTVYLGIFADAMFNPPSSLTEQIAECRREFDALNISILTEFLSSKPIRADLAIPEIVEEFKNYMDFFNMQYQREFLENIPSEVILHKHEERCRRQVDILLHGVLGSEQ